MRKKKKKKVLRIGNTWNYSRMMFCDRNLVLALFILRFMYNSVRRRNILMEKVKWR